MDYADVKMGKVMERMKSGKIKLFISIIEFFIICAGLEILLGTGTRSVFPVAIAASWFVLKSKVDSYEMTKSEKCASAILALLFSISVELVKVGEIRDRLNGIERLVSTVILFISLLGLFYFVIKGIWKKVGESEWVMSNGIIIQNKQKLYWIFTGIIFATLFLGLILDLPGDLSKDSVAIIAQASYDMKMNAGFSFAIIWVMRFCLWMSSLLGGGASLGLVFYFVLQILAMSMVEGYIAYSLAQMKVNKYIVYLSVLFFAAMPYNIQLSHTVWKDIPFSICCVWLMLLVWKQSMAERHDFDAKYILSVLAVVTAGIGTCIYRTNGYYAYIFFLPLSVILFWKKRKDMILAVIAAFVLVLVIQGPVTDHIVNSHNKKFLELNQVEDASKIKTDNSNMMNSYGASGIRIVTIQQIAAVAMNRDDITDEDRILIDEILDIDKLRDKYNPGISDNTLRASKRSSTGRYLQIWLKLGMKYPSTYVSAWKDMTYGYWYPDMEERWIYVEENADNDYGIEEIEFLPHFVYKIRDGVDKLYKVIPGYGLLWSIGFIVWITAFAIALTVVKRGVKRAICFAPLVGVWLSLLIATPVYGEFRYLYPFFLALPMTVTLPFVERVSGN